jgi:uncharacterized small protein (DUF1192 family)
LQADLERRIAQLEKENEQLRAQAPPRKEPVEEKRNYG